VALLSFWLPFLRQGSVALPELAFVQPRHQVAQRRQGVVVFVDGVFVVGVLAPAVKGGFLEKVGAGARQDFQGAGVQAGGDGVVC